SLSTNDFKRFNDFKHKFIVSYFGNMGTAQDMDTLKNTMKILRDNENIHFMCAGHGNKLQFLKEFIKEEKLDNVNVYEFLHGTEFDAALEISNCFIVSLAPGLTGLAVPSKTYSYMMAGKPIISIMGKKSDISQDLLRNNAGYAFEV